MSRKLASPSYNKASVTLDESDFVHLRQNTCGLGPLNLASLQFHNIPRSETSINTRKSVKSERLDYDPPPKPSIFMKPCSRRRRSNYRERRSRLDWSMARMESAVARKTRLRTSHFPCMEKPSRKARLLHARSGSLVEVTSLGQLLQ